MRSVAPFSNPKSFDSFGLNEGMSGLVAGFEDAPHLPLVANKVEERQPKEAAAQEKLVEQAVQQIASAPSPATMPTTPSPTDTTQS